MFDPEHIDIGCPKCLRRRVYLDRKIGYYCMFCGYELGIDEALFLIAKAAARLKGTHVPSDRAPRPIVEIREHPARREETKHTTPRPDTGAAEDST